MLLTSHHPDFLVISPPKTGTTWLAANLRCHPQIFVPDIKEWLQEHGYWSEGEHCLDPNIHHVKGCWVVDWVTGRE